MLLISYITMDDDHHYEDDNDDDDDDAKMQVATGKWTWMFKTLATLMEMLAMYAMLIESESQLAWMLKTLATVKYH